MNKPVEVNDESIIKVKITLDAEFKNKDFKDLENNLVLAYRKFSEITKCNIVGGEVEEL